jgi:prepilin-type N-terminal cleavage/methylation domain-containing protein
MVWRLRRTEGFTLLEIVIVIAIMGFLAAMVVPFVGHLDRAQRAKMTRERLEAVRTAVTGPPQAYDERGLRVVRGYAGDREALPKLYQFSWHQTERRWEVTASGAVYEEVYHGGDIAANPPHIGQPLGLWEKFTPDGGATAWERWRGPYLGYPKAVFAIRDKEVSPLRQTEGVLADAWGRVLFFIKEQGEAGDPNSLYLLLVSAGPDGKVKLPPAKTPAAGPLVRGADAVYDKTAPENVDNIVLEITPDEWYRANLGVQEEKTRQILEKIRTALLGPPDAFDPSGRRIVGGYIGDLGRWPALWGWDSAANPPRWVTPPPPGTAAPQPRGLWVWDAAEGYSDHDPPATDPRGFRWRGSYLQKPWGTGADEVLRDAWGTPLRFELGGSPPAILTVTSAGRDKRLETGGDNLELAIAAAEWRTPPTAIKGSIRNSGTAGTADVTLSVHHQPGEPALTVSESVYAGATVPFSLPLPGGAVPFAAGPRLLKVTVAGGTLKSPAASAPFVELFIGVGGTQAPVAEKLVVVVESP